VVYIGYQIVIFIAEGESVLNPAIEIVR
jgi:hypothetical protein